MPRLDTSQVNEFQHDGVLLLQGYFSDWIDTLRDNLKLRPWWMTARS